MKPPMRSIWVFFLALAALAGCSGGNEQATIARTCVRDGGAQPMCDCLAQESVKSLERPALQAVVLGAQGQDAAADKQLATMTADQNLRFRSAMDSIVKSCNAADFLAK